MAVRRLVLLCAILLGVCGVITWRHYSAAMDLTDFPRDGNLIQLYPHEETKEDIKPQNHASVRAFKLTKGSDLDLDKEMLKNLHMCNEIDESTSQILRNRLSILQEYIPANFSTKFDNPCWYDFHQKPSVSLGRISNCRAVAVSYREKVAQSVLKEVKKSNESHLYCVPAFYLLGFPKCATTTLYKMIAKHPLIADTQCQTKENNFWSWFMNSRGTDLDKKVQTLHYLNYYSQSQSMQTVESNPQSKILDGSVSYLIWATWASSSWITDSDLCILPSLFTRVLPEAKFIVIMRNPTERTFSHYYYYSVIRANKILDSRNVDNAEVFESFHKHSLEAVTNFQSCVDGGHSVFYCVNKQGVDGDAINRDGYVGIQTSLYYYRIVPWLSVIPRERFLFLRTEDLAYAPQLMMTKVWNFLDLYNLPDNIRIFENVNRQADGLTLPSHTKELLDDFFRPYNQLLAHLLSDNKYLWND